MSVSQMSWGTEWDWLCFLHGHCPLSKGPADYASNGYHGSDSFTTNHQLQSVYEVGDSGFGRAPAMIFLPLPSIITYFVSRHFFWAFRALDLLASGHACGEGIRGRSDSFGERWARGPLRVSAFRWTWATACFGTAAYGSSPFDDRIISTMCWEGRLGVAALGDGTRRAADNGSTLLRSSSGGRCLLKAWTLLGVIWRRRWQYR